LGRHSEGFSPKNPEESQRIPKLITFNPNYGKMSS